MHHLNPVAFAQSGNGMLATRHDIQIELDGDPSPNQIQALDQAGNGFTGRHFEGFTVQLNLHDGAVTRWKGVGILA